MPGLKAEAEAAPTHQSDLERTAAEYSNVLDRQRPRRTSGGPLTCLNDRERPRCREFASRGSGAQIPSAPLGIPGQGPIRVAGLALYGSAHTEVQQPWPSSCLPNRFESAPGLGCRDLAVNLHPRSDLAVPKASGRWLSPPVTGSSPRRSVTKTRWRYAEEAANIGT